jgi:phenylacetate-CoA ligase
MTRGATTNARRALRELQVRKLRALLREIVPQNRFWARKLAAAGLDPAGIRGLEDLERVPLTTKEELQEDQERSPPYGTVHTWPAERYVRLHQTSGTTGQPIRWLDTVASWGTLLDCWQVIYDAAGVTAADRFFFPFSFGPFIGFWAAASRAPLDSTGSSTTR